jgi:dolichyl-phosphate-mannose--protein O-mannosyl transferase
MYGKKEETATPPSSFLYEIPKGNFFGKFIQTQKSMSSVINVTASHPYSSQWWQWPLGLKPILYYLQENSRLDLRGNPVVWFCAFLGIFMFFLVPLYKKEKKVKSPTFFRKPIILYFYLFSWLFFIGVSRTSFLYYYLTPLCFSIILFALCFDFYTQHLSKKKKHLIFAILIVTCFLFFLFYLPLSYGIPLSEKAVSLRLLIPF